MSDGPARDDSGAPDIQARVASAVGHAVREHALWPANAVVVAAVSGGPDSLCLLGALLALRGVAGGSGGGIAPRAVVVAHLDHGMRPEGAADAHFVKSLAARLSLPCVAERVDVAALARAQHRSLEDAGRRARYAFLRRVAAARGAACIALGHTRDDQVETLMLHWLRGSGLAGLSGMPWRAGDVVRPLLGLTRAQTEAYCAAKGWQPRVDDTNANRRFMRNRVRHDVLPALEAINPNLRETLVRNAALLTADERYLAECADDAWHSLAQQDTHSVRLDRAQLGNQPAALRHRMYRRAVLALSAGECTLEARHIALLEQLAQRGQTGASLDLPGGLRGWLTVEALAFAPRRATPARAAAAPHAMPAATAPPTARLSVPGAVDLPWLGWRLRAWSAVLPRGLEAPAMPPAPAHAPFAQLGITAELGKAEMRAMLDADRAGDTLTVRAWQPGDRFHPLGMAHAKKLHDYFTDGKVPRALRARVPLVFGRDHLLWVAGQRIDDRARLRPDSRRVLVLQLEPLELDAPAPKPA